MPTSSLPTPALPVRRRGPRALALLVAAGMALVGCSSDPASDQPTAAATTSSAEETPTWEIRPVVGERIYALFDLSSTEILGVGPRQGVDEARANAAMAAVGDFLDDHLDRLQRGLELKLGSVLPERRGDSGELRSLRSGLATPDRPVESARYAISAFGDGEPQWISAQVEVMHPGGSSSGATLVFTLGEGDALQLVLAGPDGDVDTTPDATPDATDTSTEDEG